MKILLVEDNSTYRKVAVKVLSGLAEVAPTSTYEEGIKFLDNVDGVITDLFFPSKTDFRQVYLDEIRKEVTNNIGFIKKELKTAPNDQWLKDDLTQQKDRLTKWMRLREVPSGIAIALEAMKKKIPVVIVSQGNRHEGDLAIVRSGATAMRNSFGSYGQGWNDPIRNLLHNTSGAYDKTLEAVWRNAFGVLCLRVGVSPEKWMSLQYKLEYER